MGEVNGHAILCMPTVRRGGVANLTGGAVLETDPAAEAAGVDIGYSDAPDPPGDSLDVGQCSREGDRTAGIAPRVAPVAFWSLSGRSVPLPG